MATPTALSLRPEGCIGSRAPLRIFVRSPRIAQKALRRTHGSNRTSANRESDFEIQRRTQPHRDELGPDHMHRWVARHLHARSISPIRLAAECYSTSSIFRGYSIFMKGKDPRDAHFITSRIVLTSAVNNRPVCYLRAARRWRRSACAHPPSASG